MKTHKIVEKKVRVKKVENIYCNRCGKKINRHSNKYVDFLDIKKRWNFLSKFDNEIHSFQLCQKCYINFISEFKIPVERENRE